MACIFNKAVPIGVAKCLDPLQSRLDIRPDLFDRRNVAGPLEIHPCKHDKKRRCIDSAVVMPEWHFSEPRHFAVPGLMQNFAGLRIGQRIEGCCLSLGKKA